MTHPWTRRNWLRLAGLAALAGGTAPFLPRVGRAAEGDNKRLLIISSGNGTVLPDWRPRKNGEWLGDGETLDGSTSPILRSLLERHAERMILIDGLDLASNKDDDGQFINTRGHLSHPALWTGFCNDGAAYDAPGDGEDPRYPSGPSIDQVVANHVGTSTAVHSLSLSLERTNYPIPQWITSFTDGGAPIMPEASPAEIHRLLFGDNPTSPAPDRGPVRRRRSLEILQRQLQNLQGQLPSGDHEYISRHLAQLNDIDARLDAAALTCDPTAAPVDGDLLENSIAHAELITQAFACGATRSISYCITREAASMARLLPFIPSWSGSADDMHSASHFSRTELDAAQDISRIKQWEGEWVANLIDALHETPEGDGTLLDNTIVVWCSAMSHGGSHSNATTPCVIIHGDNGPWHTNQYIRSPGTSEIDHALWTSNSAALTEAIGNGFDNNHLLVSIANAFGIDVNHFGDPRFQGPLQELVR